MSDFTIRLGVPEDHPMVYRFTAHNFRFVSYYTNLDGPSYTNPNEAIEKVLGWTHE